MIHGRRGRERRQKWIISKKNKKNNNELLANNKAACIGVFTDSYDIFNSPEFSILKWSKNEYKVTNTPTELHEIWNNLFCYKEET